MFHRRYGSGGIDDVADEKHGNRVLRSLIMVNFVARSAPMGNSLGWWITVSSSVIFFAEGSRSLTTVNSLRCFDAIFTVLSDSVESN